MNSDRDETDPELVDLLRGLPAPPSARDGLRDHLRQKVLAEFDRSMNLPVAPLWRRAWQTGALIMSHPLSRFAMAAAVVVMFTTWLTMPRPAPAFGDLLDPLMRAKSAKFKLVAKIDTQPRPIEAIGYFLAPGRMRQEIGESVSIFDRDLGRMLSINSAQKQAMVVELRDLDKNKQSSSDAFSFVNVRHSLAEFRTNKPGQFEDLGEKVINGRREFGFRISLPAMVQTIWGDVESGEILRLEAVMSGSPKSEVVFSEFEFDLPLDESLFSVDPPAGYKLMTLEMSAAPSDEAEFIAALDKVSSSGAGEFPTGFGPAAIATAVAQLLKPEGAGKQPTQEHMNQVFAIAKGLNFPLNLPKDAEAHYAGKGVKRGDSKRPIFWYRRAEDQPFRIVWNDLSLTEAKLPPEVEGAVSVIEQIATPQAAPAK